MAIFNCYVSSPEGIIPYHKLLFVCEPSTRRSVELREVQLQELGQEPRVQKVKQSLHQVPWLDPLDGDCEGKNMPVYWTNIAIENGPVEIVDFPIKKGDLPVYADGFSENGRTHMDLWFMLCWWFQGKWGKKMQEKSWGYDGDDPCRWEDCRKTQMGNSLHLMWLKGKLTGQTYWFDGENPWFPVKIFPDKLIEWMKRVIRYGCIL